MPGGPYVEVVVRSAVVYFAVYAGLRFAGKRHMSQLSLLDFVLVLLVSNAVQNAMVGSDTSVAGGLAAAATLIVINSLLTFVITRNHTLEQLLSGHPTLLVWDGNVIHDRLQGEGISIDELGAAVREHGVASLADVRQAVLEIDGSISVIPKSSDQPIKLVHVHSTRRRMARRGRRQD